MSDNGLKPELNDLWHTYIFGMQGVQTYTDIYLWETFLNAHRFNTLIELGSGSGAFSTWLYLQCVNRGASFFTFDKVHPPALDWPMNKANGLAGRFFLGDMFSGKGMSALRGMLDTVNRPAILFCDGGNKPKEFQTFTPMMQPGDFVIVHDYGTEFGDNDAQPVAHLVRQIFPEARGLGSKTAWYERI
jgi:hypothetical protein